MRHFVWIVFVILLLVAPSPQIDATLHAASKTKIPQEEALLYVEMPEILTDHEQVVHVKSNTDMDKDSFEHALKHSLQTSDHSPFFYNFKWESLRLVHIHFRLTDTRVFTFTFNLDDAKTTDGRTFESKDQPYRNRVVAFFNVDQPSITVKRPFSNDKKVIPTWGTHWIKTIKANGTDAPSFLFYGEGMNHLYDISKNKVMDIPSFPHQRGSYGNDYGYHEMYSDRFYPGYSYMILGNKWLYKVDLIHQTRKQLYAFHTPVYAMSSSRDGTKIAVLCAHNKYLGPEADLLILNDKGKTVLTKKSAAYISHSDGFLFVYPLSWADDSHIVFPVKNDQSGRSGMALFDIKSKKQYPVKDKKITAQMIHDIYAHQREPDDEMISSVVWSPDGRLAAYRDVNEIWVYNREKRSFEFAGAGILLGWLPKGELVWANTRDHIFTF